MNVVFHTLAGGALGHVASRYLPHDEKAARWPRLATTLVAATALGVASHGVLDGLKHGYPVPGRIDVAASLLLATAWVVAVKARYRLLFLVAFCAAWLPDVMDLGPALVRRALGSTEPLDPTRHLFPWHRPDGSGSMYPAASGLERPGGFSDRGENGHVSLVNHVLVCGLSLLAVVGNRRCLRRCRLPSPP